MGYRDTIARSSIDFGKPIRFGKLTGIEIKAFLYIFIVSLIGLFSLFQANVLFLDDIRRTLDGSTEWELDGRPLASFAMLLLQVGKPLTDISPLPQILGIAFYALGSIYLGKSFGVTNFPLLVLSGIVFVLNPFNLENFSYVFDSFTMGLAVLTSAIAFFFATVSIDERATRVERIFRALGGAFFLLLTFCLYQSGISIYLAASALYCLLKLIQTTEARRSFRYFLNYLIILFLSSIAYFPIKGIYVQGTYAMRRSRIAPLADLPGTIFQNLLTSLQNIQKWSGTEELSKILLILFLSVIFSTYLSILLSAKNLKYRSIGSLVSSFFLSFAYILSTVFSFYGLSLILIDPVWQVRVFMGFSGTIGISCLYLSRLFEKPRFLQYGLIAFFCILSLLFANVSLTFGNVLHAQNTYEEAIAPVILNDLEASIAKVPNSPEKIRLALVGQLDYSSLARVAFKKYPIVQQIAIPYLSGNFFHALTRLRGLGFQFANHSVIRQFALTDAEEYPYPSEPILTRRMYKIYFVQPDIFAIDFKK